MGVWNWDFDLIFGVVLAHNVFKSRRGRRDSKRCGDAVSRCNDQRQPSREWVCTFFYFRITFIGGLFGIR